MEEKGSLGKKSSARDQDLEVRQYICSEGKGKAPTSDGSEPRGAAELMGRCWVVAELWVLGSSAARKSLRFVFLPKTGPFSRVSVRRISPV